MEIKLGCMTRTYTEHPIERALEGIARAGFRYTAYLGGHPDWKKDALEAPLDEVQALRRKMESFGLKAVTAWGGNPLQYGADGLRRRVERSHELGLEYLILSSPYVGKNQTEKTSEQALVEFLAIVEPVLPSLAPAGLRLDVKPHMGPYGAGPGLAELAVRVGDPHFGVSYDPGNIRYYEGLEPETDLPSVVKYVRSVCVKDHRGAQGANDFPNPGEGDVVWPRVFADLAGAGFSGYAMIEVMKAPTAEALDAAGAAVRKRLEEWITAAGGRVAV